MRSEAANQASQHPPMVMLVRAALMMGTGSKGTCVGVGVGLWVWERGERCGENQQAQSGTDRRAAG